MKKLKKYLDRAKKAKIFSYSDFCYDIGIESSELSNFLAGKRKVPHAIATKIHKKTLGSVPRWYLRSDIWSRGQGPKR